LALYFFLVLRPPPTSPLFPYTTLFRSTTLTGTTLTGAGPSGVGRFGAGAGCGRTAAGVGAGLVGKPGTRTVALQVGQRNSLPARSEEHTSELQSLTNLVCRLLLEKKNQ